MFWDIAVAVAAAACQFVTAWLGWRITTNPLDPIDPKQRWKRTRYHVAFVSTGILGIFFIGYAAYRAPRDRAHLDLRAWPTYQGASGVMSSWASGTGERRAEFLQVNQPLNFNVALVNVGPGVAVNIKSSKGIFIEPGVSPLSENDALAQFEKIKTIERPKGSSVLVKGGGLFVTAEGVVLSPEDYDNLVYGRRVIYMVAEFLYEDDSGSHVRRYCGSLQPPLPGGGLIWADCTGFNGEY
ncbi:MAG TPA: hypothetical protein VNU20_08235 [Candidatus Sulfotelmatobacter sp.]|jgi:hypothetical protein|nr:hypothetical protein [Candidatus Sulfotelmatobacter sp.]